LNCEQVAKVLYLDDDTVRGWRKLYEERGIAAWNNSMPGQFEPSHRGTGGGAESSCCQTLPRSTREIGAFIERNLAWFTKAARIDRLAAPAGLEYHKPEVIGRKLDTEKQQAFIEAYEKLLNSLGQTRPCCS